MRPCSHSVARSVRPRRRTTIVSSLSPREHCWQPVVPREGQGARWRWSGSGVRWMGIMWT